MKYAIYQIKNIRDTMYAFRSWKNAEKIFAFNDYKKVYEGEMEQKNILENLFVIFNINHPEDFSGHSLSVSDLVALKKDGNDYWYWYYCDSYGWKEITEIMSEKNI